MRYVILLILLCICSLLWTQERPNIALLELEGSGISAQELQGLTNRLQTELFKTQQFTMLERNKITELLEEQQFQMTGCTDLACAIEIGRLLNVEYVVIGNVDRVSSIYSVNVRLVDVTTGEIIRNELEDCPQCSLDEVFLTTLKNAAYRIAGLEVEPPQQTITETPAVTPPPETGMNRTPVPSVKQPRRRRDPRFKMGFFAGLNTSGSVEEENSLYSRKHQGSLSIGITYDVPLKGKLFLQPEFVYSNRKSELTSVYTTGSDRTDVLHYLHIPVLLAFHWTKGYSIYLGPSLGFLMSGTWESGSESDDYDKEDFNGTLPRFILGTETRFGPLSVGYRIAIDTGEENKMTRTKRTLHYFMVGLVFSP